MSEPIISPDTRRADRLPPGHSPTHDWPENIPGLVPNFDPSNWDLTLFPVPLVNVATSITWGEFQALPRVRVYADMHHADRQSTLDNLWEGVSTQELLRFVEVAEEAQFVMLHSDDGTCANVRLEAFFAEDSLLATHCNGEALSPEHGYPMRVVIPQLLTFKNAKWIRGIEFMAADRPDFWHARGLTIDGDPWQ